LVASSGFVERQKLGEITTSHFDKTFGINARGLLFTVQKALPLIRDGGSIALFPRSWPSRASRRIAPTVRARRLSAPSFAHGLRNSRTAASVSTRLVPGPSTRRSSIRRRPRRKVRMRSGRSSRRPLLSAASGALRNWPPPSCSWLRTTAATWRAPISWSMAA
jgi:NAD(P)-dependent dehydrogenase (short-subunit alcohol dehydrogenase family)